MDLDPNEIVRDGKDIINTKNVPRFKAWIEELLELEAPNETSMDWGFIVQKVYLHACNKKQAELAKWIEESVFPKLTSIQQIVHRQMFSYGRFMLR